MKLEDLVDVAEFERLVAEGYITERRHPTLPLRVYCYTKKTQYSRTWTPETRMARGLVTDDEGNVVARPFEKFYNVGEPGAPRCPTSRSRSTRSSTGP